MACDGKCVFTEIITYNLNKAGDLISFKWESKRSKTDDCEDDIEDGKGWFRIKRTNDAKVVSIDRELLTPPAMAQLQAMQTAGTLPGVGGTTEVSGGGLPTGLKAKVKRMSANDFDFTGLEIDAASPNSFSSIDINFAHGIVCECQANKNKSEVHVRFTFDSGRPAGSKISHNSNGKRKVTAKKDGTKTITFTWTVELDCKTTATNRTNYNKLKRWKELEKKKRNSTITDPEKTELRGLEDGYKESDKKLKKESIAYLLGGSGFWANSFVAIAIFMFISVFFLEEVAIRIYALSVGGIFLSAAILVGTRVFGPVLEEEPFAELESGRLFSFSIEDSETNFRI